MVKIPKVIGLESNMSTRRIPPIAHDSEPGMRKSQVGAKRSRNLR